MFYVVKLEMDNSQKVLFKKVINYGRSDNKWCGVEVRWGIFIENLTYFFLFLRAVVNIPI